MVIGGAGSTATGGAAGATATGGEAGATATGGETGATAIGSEADPAAAGGAAGASATGREGAAGRGFRCPAAGSMRHRRRSPAARRRRRPAPAQGRLWSWPAPRRQPASLMPAASSGVPTSGWLRRQRNHCPRRLSDCPPPPAAPPRSRRRSRSGRPGAWPSPSPPPHRTPAAHDGDLRRRRRLGVQRLVHDRRHPALERALAGQQLVEQDARRIDVGARVDRLAHELLGRHVGRRAHHRAGLRHAAALDPGDAEIRDLRPARRW